MLRKNTIKRKMTIKDNLTIFFLALVLALGIASTQPTPGYMDADYYYATGIQLAEGKGFTEPFLWNYLEDADGLPHPSHAYWMPLASVLAGLGMWVARDLNWRAAQIAFILLSALVPLITAHLAFSLTQKRNLAFVSAFLALFSGYYAAFLTTTDTFSLYMVLGGSFLLALKIKRLWLKAIILGFLSALIHLTRADGAIWLMIAIISLIISHAEMESRKDAKTFAQYVFSNTFYVLRPLLLLLLSYTLIISLWFLRNYAIFGTPLAPNGNQMLWLTSYDQIFAYPAGNLSLETWLASGWDEILKTRLWALKFNLDTIFGVQGGVILLPFIIIGAWQYLKDPKGFKHTTIETESLFAESSYKKRAQIKPFVSKFQIVFTGTLAWLATFIIMTLVFPFAGARGGFFHSGAALQPLWWALAPIGLARIITWMVENKEWKPESLKMFSVMLVLMMVLLTGAILWGRVLSPTARTQAQNTGVSLYSSIEKDVLEIENPSKNAAVITSNPPGYYLASERYALALPDGDIQTVFEIAKRYDAEFLVLEEGSVPDDLAAVFNAPTEWEGLTLLAEIKGAKIFVIEKE